MKQTVTFLFTDIEGSSRLWEQLGERMGSLLARHDALVRETVVAHGGAVVKFIGDGVHAAFADPHAALHCGVRLLSGVRDMPEGAGKLKLRAGLHVGVCEARDNDYFGETVNRAARIAHAAHGGQFIVSDAVASALNGAVSDSVSLRTLGRIRLRDLSGEETLHQVLHRDLPGDFPPLRSLSQAPNNLPNQRTSFIGRHAEVCKLAAQLDEHRLVTVVGTGGIGKTRLALQTGARVLERFEEGVWLIELAGIADAGRIAEALLSTWNLAVAPGNSAEDTLCEYLAPRRALLLLDNCEHLIDACAALVDLILRRAPNVKIVATSREPLDVDGESLYRIPGLPLPDPDFEGSVDALCEVEAVRLFVERARLQQPDWTVTPQDAPQLATLCYRLDGIPLAIELAAARMRDMALAELLRGIEDRFGFLVTGSRVAPPRHKTLAGMIDWSCRLLKPAEQRLFRRLAVFQGGIPAPLALRVCADPALAPDEIETALVELAGKSLLTGGEGRFGMLETLRQFAAGELQQADEMHATQRAHALAFAAWAAPISEELRALSAGEQTALLMRDEENLSRALEFALTQPDCGNTALSLAASMGLYWQHRGGSKHSAGMLHRALQHPGADRISADRVHVEYARAVLAYLDADMGAAKRHAIGSRDIARELRLDAAAARAQTMVAYATYVQDGYAASRAFFLQAMDDCRAANLENSRLIAACNFATNAFFAGDHSAAHA
ncbi:MAG: adenylate/guanylate cyclase domain-containing protein, partial [Betaproteobacteria bacterium]|nr:adenylate/guanylate cyclase domain-containing protein [Betaproteobacteria bacterium]